MTTTDDRRCGTSTPTATSSSPRRGCSSSRRPSTGTASGTSRPTPTASSIRVERRPHAVDRPRGAPLVSPTKTSTGSATARSTIARPGPRDGRRRCGCRHGHRRDRRLGAVPDHHARAPEHAQTSSSARPGARVQRLVLRRISRKDEGRLYGAGALPPMHEPDDVQAVADEIHHVAELPGMVSVFMRPNPAIEWRTSTTPSTTPSGRRRRHRAPVAFHPFLAPDLPGACEG